MHPMTIAVFRLSMCLAGTLTFLGQSGVSLADLSPFQGRTTQKPCTFHCAWRTQSTYIKHDVK